MTDDEFEALLASSSVGALRPPPDLEEVGRLDPMGRADEALAAFTGALVRLQAVLARELPDPRKRTIRVQCHGGPSDGDDVTAPTDRPLLPEMQRQTIRRDGFLIDVYRLGLNEDDTPRYRHAGTRRLVYREEWRP